MNGVYPGHSPFQSGPVALVLNTRNVHVFPQYHVVFDDTLSTMDHMRKDKVPGNWKNMVEENSELATQENVTISK